MTIILTGSDESEIEITASRVNKSGDSLTIEINQPLLDPEPVKELDYEVFEGSKSYGNWRVAAYNWMRDDKGFAQHQLYLNRAVNRPGSL